MSSQKISRAQIKALSKRELRNANKQHETEVDRLKFANKKQIDEIKRSHRDKVNIVRHENRVELSKEINKKELQLEDIKKHLKSANEHSQKELARLNASHKQRLEIDKARYEGRAEEAHFHREEQIKNQIQDGELQLKRVRAGILDDKNQVIKDIKNDKNSEIESHSRLKNRLVQKQFTEKRKMELAYKDDLVEVNREQKKYLRRKLDEHKKIITDAQKKHNIETEHQDQYFKKTIENLKSDKQDRYTDYYKQSEKKFQELKGQQNKIVKQMRDEITQEHNINQRKSLDPFYDFGKLNPDIIDDGKKIVIELNIPEFMVKDINVTSEENYIKLNMTRRYGQDIINEDGVRNKMSKYETYSSKIPTNDRIDPKSMIKVYEKGALKITHFYKA